MTASKNSRSERVSMRKFSSGMHGSFDFATGIHVLGARHWEQELTAPFGTAHQAQQLSLAQYSRSPTCCLTGQPLGGPDQTGTRKWLRLRAHDQPDFFDLL